MYPWAEKSLEKLLAIVSAVPPVVLISGAPGIGKTELARAFCRALLCEARAANGASCGHCGACQWFDAGNHPDFRLLVPAAEDAENTKADASKEIRIVQIREIAGFVNTGAHRAGRRVVMLDPADALNAVSANALLKLLEEPTTAMHVVLVTARPQRLPATLRSRCFSFVMPSPSAEQAADWIAATLKIDAAEARLALAASGGSVSQAASQSDAAVRELRRSVLEQLFQMPEADSARVADRLTPIEAAVWMPLLQRWTTDLSRVLAGAAPLSFPAKLARLQQLARRTDLAALAQASARLDRQSALVSRPLNARLFCESVLFDYYRAFTA